MPDGESPQEEARRFFEERAAQLRESETRAEATKAALAQSGISGITPGQLFSGFIDKLPEQISFEDAVNIAGIISAVGSAVAFADIGSDPLDFGIGGFVASFLGRIAQGTIFKPLDQRFRRKFRYDAPSPQLTARMAGTIGVSPELMRDALLDASIDERFVEPLVKWSTAQSLVAEIKQRADLKRQEVRAAQQQYDLLVDPVLDDLKRIEGQLRRSAEDAFNEPRDERITTLKDFIGEVNKVVPRSI